MIEKNTSYVSTTEIKSAVGTGTKTEMAKRTDTEVEVKSCDDSDSESDGIANSSKSHLKRSPCEICEDTEHKYTCPGCSMKTCSLPCIRSHKERLGCSGERDKTAFVDMSQYKDLHLLSDYRFLEDAERTLYSNKSSTKRKPRGLTGNPYHLSKRSKYLVNASFKRGVKLRMLPQFLSKNKHNMSYYHYKTDCIDWHIEWLFATPGTVVKVKDQKVKETTKLLDAAAKFINFMEYPHLKKPLNGLDKTTLPLCQFLLKVEGLPANRTRFFPLNPDNALVGNLLGQCLTEHPCIHVVPASHSKENYIHLSKEDMTYMSQENARHMAKYFSHLRTKEDSETQLLNPQSNVYVPKPVQTHNTVLINPSQTESPVEAKPEQTESSMEVKAEQTESSMEQTDSPVGAKPEQTESLMEVKAEQTESPMEVNTQQTENPILGNPKQTTVPMVVNTQKADPIVAKSQQTDPIVVNSQEKADPIVVNSQQTTDSIVVNSQKADLIVVDSQQMTNPVVLEPSQIESPVQETKKPMLKPQSSLFFVP